MAERELTPDEQRRLDQFESAALDVGGVSYAAEYELGAGAVEKMLVELVHKTDLTLQQAGDVLNLIGEGGGIYEAAGFVVGEFDISPMDIERATDGEVKAKQIDEQKRNFWTTAGDVLTSVDKVTDPFGEALIRGFKRTTGIRGFGTGESVIDKEQGIFGYIVDTEAEAREKRARAEVRDDIRKVIDILNDEGYLSDGDATKMKSVTDNYNVSTYKDLLTELTDELDGFEFASEGQMRFINETMTDIRNRIPTVKEGDGSTDVTDADATPEEEGEEGLTIEEAVGRLDTFSDLMEFTGILSATMELPEEPDKSTFQYINIDGEQFNFAPIGPGPEGLFDPLYVSRESGAVMTNSQYDAIMASDVLKQRYAELGKQQGYSARVTELLDMSAFKPRSEGGGGLPIMNLDNTIPTAVVTEDWQRPLYNWDYGSGAAQWRGMAAYARRAKVDYMVNNGLIREDERDRYDDPFSIAGQQMWEQVNGVSRDGQMDQYTAMKKLGEEATLIRSAMYSTGGYSGRIAPTYSVPASLRAIPDYEALATETRTLFRPTLGRDLEDNELAFLADELGEQYKTRNDQLIQAHKSAWDDGLSGGTVDVDDIEVTDPASALIFEIEDRYSDELGRQEDVEEYGQSRQLLIDSIAVGQRMI